MAGLPFLMCFYAGSAASSSGRLLKLSTVRETICSTGMRSMLDAPMNPTAEVWRKTAPGVVGRDDRAAVAEGDDAGVLFEPGPQDRLGLFHRFLEGAVRLEPDVPALRQPRVGDEHVRARRGVAPGVLGAEDIGERQKAHVGGHAHGGDLPVEPEPDVFQLVAQAAVHLADGGVVDDPRVPDVGHPLEEAAHVAGGVDAEDAADDRRAADGVDDEFLPHLEHHCVGVPDREVPQNRAVAVHAEMSRVIDDDQVDARAVDDPGRSARRPRRSR